jgi:hypothetical protein
MDRISMKKFKFQTTTDVFMQCKIRACAQQPCGVCTGAGQPYRELAEVDLSPVEGEMFSPPVNVKVGMRDKNALVFPDSTQTAPSAPSVVQQLPTKKQYEVVSEMTLSSVTASWAAANRNSIVQAIRESLNVPASASVVLLAIKKVLGRRLQSGDEMVKIDFAIGSDNLSDVVATKGKLEKLATGEPSLISFFSTKLDEALQSRGEPAINLKVSDMSVKAPEQREQTVWQGAQGGLTTIGGQRSQAAPVAAAPVAAAPDSTKDSEINAGLIIVLCVAVLGVVGASIAFFIMARNKENANKWNQEGQWQQQQAPASMYESKIAHMDQGYGGYDQNASWEGQQQWQQGSHQGSWQGSQEGWQGNQQSW